MGINGLFPKISPACHRADVVALLRPGLPVSSDDAVGLPPSLADETSGAIGTNANGKRSADAVAAGGDADASDTSAAAGPTKRRRTGKNTSSKTSASHRRRRVRVAVDASGWIARAAHGQGTHLLDERTLTNYGRAELTGSVEQGSNAAAAAESVDGPEGSGIAAAPDPAADQDAYEETLRQEYKQRCVTTVIKRVLTLRDVCLADVLVVLDGASPPIKKATVGQRRDRRDAAVAMRDAPVAVAAAAAEGGDLDQDEQQQQQQQQQQVPSEADRISAAKRAGAATSQIQYEIVHAVMVALQSECVPYLVAPYEADGQLGYLARTGLADMIVTDDTDLMACGASSILYKFSDWGLNHGVSGGVVSGGVTGQLFLRSRLGCTPSPLSLLDFSDVMLAAMFVAAGCDYCKNLKGIGIVTARKCVKEAFHGYGPNMSSSEANADNPVSKRTASSRGDTEPKLSKLFRLLYQNGYSGKKMTREERVEYETNFCKALIMFRHPVVFDPIAGKCVVVNDPAMGGADPELCSFKTYANLVSDPAMLQNIVGKVLTPARAALIAEGRINARTGRPFGEKKDDQVESIEQQGSGETSRATATEDATGAALVAAKDDGRAMLIDTGEEEEKEEEEDGAPQQTSECNQEGADAGMNADTSKVVAGTDANQRKKDKRLCRIDGCKKYKQSNCDDMCRAHWKENQEPPSGESEEDEESEMLATQQPQPFETQDESPMAQGESQDSVDDSEKTQDIDPKDVGVEKSNGIAEGGQDVQNSIPPKDNRLCRIDGCAKYKQSKCDDMCRAHWTESQEATGDAEGETSEVEEEDDEEPIATQQPQQQEKASLTTQQPQSFEADSKESESQTELPATQPSPSERDITLSFATQADLPSTQSQFSETQEQFTARESLSLATAAASEAQSFTARGTQDSEITSQPATQASSGNAASQLSSSQSQDPDALSPDLLAPSPSQKTADTQDGTEVGDEDKNKGLAETESPPRASRQKVQAQSPPRGIQGVLARLMGRK